MLRHGIRWAAAGLLLAGLTIAQDPKPADQSIRVECHGQLRDGIVAIGGETTGTTLRFRGITWELAFKDAEGKAFAKAHHKQPVRVIGALRRVGGVERPARWIVDVTEFATGDPASKKDGVQVTQTGTLIRDPNDPNQLFVDTGTTACPVKLPADVTVRPGQKIRLRGDVAPPTEASAKQPFFIRATQVEPADGSVP